MQDTWTITLALVSDTASESLSQLAPKLSGTYAPLTLANMLFAKGVTGKELSESTGEHVQ